MSTKPGDIRSQISIISKIMALASDLGRSVHHITLEMTFRQALISVEVSSTYFTPCNENDSPKIKHSLLVNFGKPTQSLCDDATRTDQSNRNPPDSQLFRYCA